MTSFIQSLMKIAKRMNLLGSETAFAVSAEAAKLGATGKKIFKYCCKAAIESAQKHLHSTMDR